MYRLFCAGIETFSVKLTSCGSNKASNVLQVSQPRILPVYSTFRVSRVYWAQCVVGQGLETVIILGMTASKLFDIKLMLPGK